MLAVRWKGRILVWDSIAFTLTLHSCSASHLSLLQPAETLFNSQDPCPGTDAYCHWRCPRVSHHFWMMAWKCRDPKGPVWYLSCHANILAHWMAHAAFQFSIPCKCRIGPLLTCRHIWQRQNVHMSIWSWVLPFSSDLDHPLGILASFCINICSIFSFQ